MKRIAAIVLFFLSFLSYGQNFLQDAYLINPDPYSVRPLSYNDSLPALQRPGNFIYKPDGNRVYVSNGSEWVEVWGEGITNFVFVSQKSDFPKPVNGVITVTDLNVIIE